MFRRGRPLLVVLAAASLLVAAQPALPAFAGPSTAQQSFDSWSPWTNQKAGADMAIGVRAGSTTSGARVAIGKFTGALDQYWLGPATNAWVRFLNEKLYDTQNKRLVCMGTQSGAVTNGTPVVIWGCVGHDDQSWLAVPVAGTYYYELRNYRASNAQHRPVCLGTQNGLTAQGTGLVIWACNGHQDQHWYRVLS